MADWHPRSENPKWDTTEWDDIQRKLGNLPPTSNDLPTLIALEEAERDQILAEKAEKANEDRLRKAEKDELDFEDFEDEEEERFMEEYRRRRLVEMQQKAASARYGAMTYIDATEWEREVTRFDGFVVVLLFKEGLANSSFLEQLMTQVAKQHPATKFVKIVSTNAIKDYPDKNVPTVLVYNKSSIVKQIIGIIEYGGQKATVDDVEWVLAQTGAIQTEQEDDPRERFLSSR